MKRTNEAIDRHIIWSNVHLDLDDWRDFLMENYPELPEDKLYEKMHELNAEYLDDERRNLDIHPLILNWSVNLLLLLFTKQKARS